MQTYGLITTINHGQITLSIEEQQKTYEDVLRIFTANVSNGKNLISTEVLNYINPSNDINVKNAVLGIINNPASFKTLSDFVYFSSKDRNLLVPGPSYTEKKGTISRSKDLKRKVDDIMDNR